METFEINAELRADKGKGASRRLRHAGKVPGILYGADQEPVNLMFNHEELMLHLAQEAFYSHILDLKLGSDKQAVVLKDLQRHPARPTVMHVDFLRVDQNKALVMHIPIHFLNEEECPGHKLDGGVISHVITDVEISCFPKDLPEFITIDLAELRLDQSLMLSDLNIPDGVQVAILAHGGDDQPVVSIFQVRAPLEDEEGEASAEGDAAAEDGADAGESDEG